MLNGINLLKKSGHDRFKHRQLYSIAYCDLELAAQVGKTCFFILLQMVRFLFLFDFGSVSLESKSLGTIRTNNCDK